jgi:AbrB family looped-hinge helix DNA binding protein
MKNTVTVTSKNQITIPSDLAFKYQIKKGEKLVVRDAGNAIYLAKQKSVLDQLSGSLVLSPQSNNISPEKAIELAREKRAQELADKL